MFKKNINTKSGTEQVSQEVSACYVSESFNSQPSDEAAYINSL